MNFDYLNEMIQYLESHLTEDIDYKKLAKMVGVSEYSLQRIFMFITNMSLSEYIRKRRLSKAFEELKMTDSKIIDIAIKYKYDSPISFTRAFKSMFGITPSECKVADNYYKLYPIIRFNNNDDMCSELTYEIKNIEEKEIFCYETIAKNHDDFLYNIRKLYYNLEKEKILSVLNKNGMYGISYYKNNQYYYYLGSCSYLKNTKKVTLPKGKYVLFSVGSREQKDIVNYLKLIYTQWVQSTDYRIDENYSFEFYEGDNCYLYILLK